MKNILIPGIGCAASGGLSATGLAGFDYRVFCAAAQSAERYILE